jgi:hypothetical protein
MSVVHSATASPFPLSDSVSSTRSSDPCCIGRVSQNRLHNPTSPFPTRRLPRAGFPAFHRYYEDAKTAPATFDGFASRSPFDPLLRCSLCVPVTGFVQKGSASWSPGLLFRRYSLSSGYACKVTGGSPKFPGNPCASALFSDPGPTSTPGIAASRCCPHGCDDEDSGHNTTFGVLSHGFCTRCLRFVPPSLTTTQDSLPAGCQPLPDGTFTHWVPTKGFERRLHTHPPFLGFAWRDTPAAFAKRFGEPQPYMRPRRRRGEVRTCPASRDTAVPTGRSGLSPIVWLDPKTLPLAPHASHRKGSRRFLALSGVIGSNVLSAVECRPSVRPFMAARSRCSCLSGHLSAPGLLLLTTAFRLRRAYGGQAADSGLLEDPP